MQKMITAALHKRQAQTNTIEWTAHLHRTSPDTFPNIGGRGEFPFFHFYGPSSANLSKHAASKCKQSKALKATKQSFAAVRITL